MADKFALMGYLTGLQSVVQFQTTQTGSTVSETFAREHGKVYQQLRDMIAEEHRKDDEQEKKDG